MILLLDFSVIKPDVGLAFWALLIFVLFWALMARFAFKPIQAALKKREHDIQSALDEAKKAREDMANLKSANEELLRKANEERSAILREAKEAKDSIVNEAKTKAQQETQRMIADAKLEIDNQKKMAMAEVKNQIGIMALDIAEKVIRKELKGNSEQEAFANNLVSDIHFN